MANTNYTGLPELPQPNRAEPGADAQGNTVAPAGPLAQQPPQPFFRPRPVKQQLEPEQPQKKRSGGFGPGIGCRTISMLFSLLVIALVVFVIYLLIYRPPQFWVPIKEWLNEDLQAVEYNSEREDQVLEELFVQTQSFNVGTNELLLSEEAVNILVNRELEGENRIFVDVQDQRMKVFADVDNEKQEGDNVPLWVVAGFKVDPENPNNLLIDGVGTERVKTPDFLNDFILDAILSTGNALTRSEAESILELIVILPDNAKITAVRMEEDEMVLVINLTSGLENLFQ